MTPFSLLPPPVRPRRRCLWMAELARLAHLVAEWRFRDRQRHEAAVAAIERQIADIRFRLADLERATGAADLHRAPGRGEFRRLRVG